MIEPFCPTFGGFIVSVPSAGIPHGFYVPPDKSYRVAPPAGWEIIPRGDCTVEFQSRLADQGYWPCMLISRETATGPQPIEPEEEAEINALAAQDRQGFRFVSGELMDLPFGRAYLVIYEHTFEKLRMRTAEAHFVQNGRRYWVPFNAFATTFDRQFPAYLNCLKTFAPLGTRNNQICN